MSIPKVNEDYFFINLLASPGLSLISLAGFYFVSG